MKVLIAGAAGFVGSSLARGWREANPVARILGIDNLSRPGSEANRGMLKAMGVPFVHADVRVSSDLESLPRVDWVIDAAADPGVQSGSDAHRGPRRLVEQNLAGTLNLLEYCRIHRAGFILLSTSRVYSAVSLARLDVEVENDSFRPVQGPGHPAGLSRAGVTESFPSTSPLSLYGATKLASEILALEYGENFGFPVFVNRCGNLAGSGQFGHCGQGVYNYWIRSWIRHRPLAYTGFGGKGHQVRDLLHPLDLLDLIMRQTDSERQKVPLLVNVGGGPDRALSLANLSKWCAARFGAREVAADPETRRNDVPWLVMDCARATEAWNWRPAIALDNILSEICGHAEDHPDWLDLSAEE
jgi:CDP-paratose 2-epimerase